MPPISRRLHWYAPPAIGNSDASSAYTASNRHWPDQRDGQDPHPRRTGHGQADERDRVQADDGGDAGESDRGVVEEAQATRQLLSVPELLQARGVGIDGRRERRHACAPADPAPLALDRPRDLDPRRTPSLWKMLRRCDSIVLSLRKSAAAISRFVSRSVTSTGDLELALGERVDTAVSRGGRAAWLGARAEPP